MDTFPDWFSSCWQMYTPEPRTNICWMTFEIVFVDPFLSAVSTAKNA
jgi:uncharacterized membrane protein YhdT